MESVLGKKPIVWEWESVCEGERAAGESRPGGICVEPQMCAAWTSALSAAIVKEAFKMVDISILQSLLFRQGLLGRGQSRELGKHLLRTC